MAEADDFCQTRLIRRVLQEYADLHVRIDDLDDHADLYHAGMTSLASVNVMLALEDSFNLEFPDRLLRKQTFVSIQSIKAALAEAATGERP